MTVAKILVGLGQIMSKQPETLKEELPVRDFSLLTFRLVPSYVDCVRG